MKFLARASSSEFFIPVYCVEDTMVRPHTFIITASQGERTLFGTIFLCTALSYQVSEREQILPILSGRRHKGIKAFWLKTQAKQFSTHARPRLPPFKAVQAFTYLSVIINSLKFCKHALFTNLDSGSQDTQTTNSPLAWDRMAGLISTH